MKQHKACAVYILDKMQSVDIRGSESETHSDAKQWLRLIIQGQFDVQVNSDSSADGVLTKLGDRQANRE